MDFLIGMIGALLVVVLFGLGVFLGWSLRGMTREQPKPYEDGRSPEEIAKERKRLIEEQEAFRQQMEYNAETAYGMSGNEELYK
jgi:hypothetical protein